jgi:predicted amidohydrolase YtcJ
VASGSSLQLDIPLSEAGSASCLRHYHRSSAEILFTGGQDHTVNATNDIVEAVAVGGGRLLTVGSTADIRALPGPGTREIEQRGCSLLPGFIDAHCHLTGLGMSMVSIDCKARGMQIVVGGEVVYEG